MERDVTNDWAYPAGLSTPRTIKKGLECGPSERQHHLGVGREDSDWGQRTTEGVFPEYIEIRASLQPMF